MYVEWLLRLVVPKDSSWWALIIIIALRVKCTVIIVVKKWMPREMCAFYVWKVRISAMFFLVDGLVLLPVAFSAERGCSEHSRLMIQIP